MKSKKFLSWLLMLAMVLSLMPAMSQTAFAGSIDTDPLTLTAQDDSVTISLKYLPKNAAYQYSVDDGASWAAFTSAVTVNDGGSIRICMDPSVKAADVTYGMSLNKFLQFQTEGEGTLTASGDVMSLLAADTENLPNYVFYKLFSGVKNLTDASELKLPATTLAEACYSYMFNGCTGLTEAPELPATTLAKNCYNLMFQGCTALTAAPELPATTLAEACYANMFYGCAGLTEAPELPATELEDQCYNSMFKGCTGLTEAPELPATTLAKSCYGYMFQSCTGLTEAPELPATELEEECYKGMFNGCTGLTEAPELPATTLAKSCYASMFYGCTGLKIGTAETENEWTIPATTAADDWNANMFYKCTGVDFGDGSTTPALNTTYYQTLPIHSHKDWTAWGDDEAEKSTLPAEEGSYYLVSDIVLGEYAENKCLINKNITLCLNGHAVDLGSNKLSIAMDKRNGVTFDLYDCDTDTVRHGHLDEDGAWIADTEAGTDDVSLTGGILTGNRAGRNERLIEVCEDCTFAMHGGNIVGARAGGYILYANETGGCFAMDGGRISYNVADGIAAVCATSYGGSLVLTGGEISHNSAPYCGVTCFGGEKCNITVGGTVKITDNIATDPSFNSSEQNLYLWTKEYSQKPFKISTEVAPEEGMEVGVTVSTAPTDEAPVQFTDVGGNDEKGYFFSDNSEYMVAVGGTGSTYLQLALAPKPVAFTATGDVTISLAKTPTGSAYQYSADDGETWTDFTAGVTVNDGASVLVRMDPSVKASEVTYDASKNYLWFKTEGEGTLAVSGNVSTLLAEDTESLPNRAFYRMFLNVKNLTDASELVLPAATPSEYCYSGMFWGCTGLTAAPALPAAKLAKSCYVSMFWGCTGLTAAPELNATELAELCYNDMFNGCTGLTAAPELPTTELAESCYLGMFRGCTGLTAAPELPATELAKSCYAYMFEGCTGLTAAPELPATELAESCYNLMFYRCTGLTEAPELKAAELEKSCYESMFNGCTGLTEAPELPATALAESCYNSMFKGCTGLTAAPELPATELAEKCYLQMFNGCTGLTEAPELKAAKMAQSCYNQMFIGCTGLTEAPELPATELAEKCYSQMFRGCTGLTAAPELPATALAGNCYEKMFCDCTGLTSAPELPATELAKECYLQMFQGCTGLTSAPELPATALAEACYANMFQGCTGLTEAPELPATELAEKCYYQMFKGCTGLKIGVEETDDEWKIPAQTDADRWNKEMFDGCTGVDFGEGSKEPALNTTYYQVLSVNAWKEIGKAFKATSCTDVPVKDDDGNDLFTYTVDSDTVTITLKADITAKEGCTAIAIPEGKNVTVDLNGHTLDAGGVCGIFSVAKDAALTLNDSAKSGKLTGGAAYKGGAVENLGVFTMNGGAIENCEAIHKDGETADGNGGGVYNAGTFNMNGGTIDGCTAYCGGAGVFNEYVESVFNFNGGTIKNCTAANETMQDSCGGGIYNNMGKVVMDSGIIDGCSAQKNGGGVYNTGVFEMKSGEIKNCSTKESCGAGGGVYNAMNTVMNFYRTTFNMFGGKITGCSAQFGGAIANEGNAEASCYVSIKGASQLTGNEAVDGGGAIYNLGEMKLNDTASITGNKAGGLGGGVYSDGIVTLCKSVKISDNKQGETTANNLYLDANAELKLNGLTTGAQIGIGMKAEDGVFVSSDATLELAGYFKSDGNKFVLLKDDKLVLSDVSITGSDDKLVGDLDAVNAALDKISEIETAIDTLADNFNGTGEGNATSESILNVLGSYGYVDVDLTGIKFEQKAENTVETTEITTFTFDVTPYTVVGETASEQHTLVSEVTFRLPLLATDYKYANIYHNGSFLKQVELSGTDEYIELSAKNFSEYSYMLTNTKYTVPTGGGSISNTITAPASVEHGKVSADKQSASAGETITITVTPDKGYVLDTLTVKDANGKEIELTKVNDTTYTFKMPNGKVTVEATFMEDNSMLNFFVDVHANDFYYDAVLWAAKNGITDGTDATHFSPNMGTTRAHVVTFLWRAAGCPEPKAMTSFADVEVGSYYEKAVAWALETGVTKGTSATTFSPNSICTRGQIVTFLYRYNGMDTMNIKDNKFVDVAENDYYYNAVLWAAENGVTSGTSATTFSPASNCTRGQVVTFLYRLLAK